MDLARTLGRVALLFLLSTPLAKAESSPPFKVDRRMGSDHLILSAPDCDQARVQLEAIRSWTTLQGEAVVAFPDASVSSSGRCEIMLSGSLPSSVQQSHGTAPRNTGPNCWNTVLQNAKMVAFSRYSAAVEFTHWMNSPNCRNLEPGEATQSGDIIAIRSFAQSYTSQRRVEIHAFVHLTDDLSYSKNGLTSSSPFQIQATEKIYESYDLGVDRLQCRRASHGVSRSECPVWSEAYRCSAPGEDYLAYQNNSRWNWLLEQLERQELQMNTWVYGGDYDDFALASLKASLEDLSGRFVAHYELLRVSVYSRQDQDNLVYLQTTIDRIASLKEQVNLLFQEWLKRQPRFEL